jgi:tetratricopeptide (TPR) repeat protein
LRNAGADYYQDKKYKAAYENFAAMTDAHKMVKDFGEKSTIEDKDINIFKYYAGLCAQQAEMKTEAITLYKGLAADKHDEPGIYESLYTLLSETDEAAALNYLDQGVKAYPKYSGLIFAQINYYLKKGELPTLLAKLDQAIELEPKNMALYTTKASVLNNLYQLETTNKNTAKATEYYNMAMGIFKDVIAKDPKNFDAQYSLGELVYNQAAGVSKELIASQDDNSKEGVKKYDILKAKMDGLFAEALPYFEAAEKLNPNDYNTLVALKEIYVRTKQYDKSKECKAKIEALPKKG